MTIWHDIEGACSTPLTARSVVTIGNFDGVHRGHQHVVARAREVAGELSRPALPVVAVTFEPHPLAILAPERAPLSLTSLSRRITLLKAAGADHVYVLRFSREMSSWRPEEFVRRVVVDDLGAAAVVVGENFRFGHRAAGDLEVLRSAGHRHDFVVEGLPLDGGDEDFSSTLVRRLLAASEVAGAADVLGRPFAVEGEVVRGDQRGRELGFPTANVPADPAVATPADGVYAGWLTRPHGERLPAAISVGTNPTFDGVERRVESFVIDHVGADHSALNLYGEHVTVEFVAWLRGMEKFDSVDALIVQMHADVDAAREILTS